MKPLGFVLAATFLLSACGAPSATPSFSVPKPQLRSVSGAHFIAEYPISGPSFSLAEGRDGNVWFTEVFANKIGRITPAGALTEFDTTVSGLARVIAPGPDGNMWFTLANGSGGYLVSVNASGVFSLHQLPTRNPRFIATGPDGNIWYTDDNIIGKYESNGTVTQYAIPTPDSSPRGLFAAPDGKLWFAESAANKIASITTDGAIAEFPVTSAPFGQPSAIDGHVWFQAQNELVGSTWEGHTSSISLADLPGGVLGGDRGRIWVTYQDLNQIASMNFEGKDVQTYDVPTPGANPIDLVRGSDGNYWFSEPSAPTPQIGVFRP